MSLPLPDSTSLEDAMKGRFERLYSDELNSLTVGDLRRMDHDDIVSSFLEKRLLVHAFINAVVDIPSGCLTIPRNDKVVYEGHFRGTVASGASHCIYTLAEVKRFAEYFGGKLDLDLSNNMLMECDLNDLKGIAECENVVVLRLRNCRIHAVDAKFHDSIRAIAKSVSFVDFCGNSFVSHNTLLFQEFANNYQSENVLDHLIFAREGWFASDSWKNTFTDKVKDKVEATVRNAHQKFYNDYPCRTYF